MHTHEARVPVSMIQCIMASYEEQIGEERTMAEEALGFVEKGGGREKMRGKGEYIITFLD